MKTKGLTATIIFEAQSLNYDEGYGNLSVIKKFHRGNGKAYTYASRQSLRYSIFTQGCQEFGWNPSKVSAEGSGDQKVTQLNSSVTESEESDLFGYMRTNVKINEEKTEQEITVVRTTPVRLLPAIALESYGGDVEMLTNKYQADKIQENPNIANSEMHRTLYRYTIAIDLHRIGNESDVVGTRFSPGGKVKKDSKEFTQFEKQMRENNLAPEDKAIRVKQLLEVVKRLYRDIKGRREDLKPLFIIGGVYDTCNPFFENIVEVEWKGKPQILEAPLKQILETSYTTIDPNNKFVETSIASETYVGLRDGKFDNTLESVEKWFGEKDKNHVGSPEFVFNQLKTKVDEYFGLNKSEDGNS